MLNMGLMKSKIITPETVLFSKLDYIMHVWIRLFYYLEKNNCDFYIKYKIQELLGHVWFARYRMRLEKRLEDISYSILNQTLVSISDVILILCNIFFYIPTIWNIIILS